MTETKMTEVDAQKQYTHVRPEPDTESPVARQESAEPDNKELMVLTEDQSVKLPSVVNVRGLGQIIAASGLFKDARQAAKAIVKVLAGQEQGFAPIFSMSNIHVIEGKISMGASIIAAKIRGSGEYDYNILELSPNGCKLSITNLRTNEVMGEASFEKADASRASLLGKSNWRKYPQDMYFARAMGRLARYHVPHLFGGAVYTPDELNAMIGDDGTVIEGVAEEISEPSVKATPAMNLKGWAVEEEKSRPRIEGGSGSEEEEKVDRMAIAKMHALELHVAGKTPEEISKIAGVPRPLVLSWLRKTGGESDAA